MAALAQQATDLGVRIATLDRQIASRFGRHRLARVICSMPGFGFRLGAERLVAIGDLDPVDAADRLAAYAGLAPVANDSGKRTAGGVDRCATTGPAARHVPGGPGRNPL